FYQSTNPFFSNTLSVFPNYVQDQTFKYNSGVTLIDSTGRPHFTDGSPTILPYEYVETHSDSSAYIGIGTDHYAHYAVAVQWPTSAYVLGGTVDYNARNGDFNHDGTVDAADYVKWRMTAGSTFDLSADANANGTIDQADYGIWRSHFGQTL